MEQHFGLLGFLGSLLWLFYDKASRRPANLLDRSGSGVLQSSTLAAFDF